MEQFLIHHPYIGLAYLFLVCFTVISHATIKYSSKDD